MKINEIGEFEFIKHIAQKFTGLPENLIGIGDDCAVIEFDKNVCMLVTTDMLVEDVHFIANKISAFDLGKKSIAVNISDIAAMGGKPHSAFISFGIPSETNLEWLDGFYSGMAEMLEKYKLFLLGGDTTSSPEKLIINIVIIGFIQRKFLKLRSGAKIGDVICVTGFLGDSGAGLKLLLEKEETSDQDEAYLIHKHNCPVPHIEEGIFLANYSEVTSMIDISDGLDSDMKRIIEMSHCGADIYLDNLPLSEPFIKVCEKYGWNRYELAATGGEDYCLLVTINSESYEKIANEFQNKFLTRLTKIGKVTDCNYSISYYLENKETVLKSIGYDHFLKSKI